jgi:mannose-1-phosphate guanylyltransferase/mannose-6-phosphate isomerase
MKITPVILCGGSGTRLWPASRESFPKQFAPLIGTRSTFQETLLRVAEGAQFGPPLIVTNRAHRFMAERQMAEIGVSGDMLLEPVGRDSGPAILAACVYMAAREPDAVLLVLAADHMMTRPEAFRSAVAQGLAAARAGHIVTFGVTPTHPATGYGYVEAGEELAGAAGVSGVRAVARFVEKPDAPMALEYISRGYFWNSGNFLFAARTMIEEYARVSPESLGAIRKAVEAASLDLGRSVLDEASFMAAPKLSIDYAVMEKTSRAALVGGDFGWSDIGGWDALHAISKQDDDANAANGDAIFTHTSGSYVSSENQLVTLLGVKDIVVAATRDAILVADRARAGEVKDLVAALKAKGREEAVRHARVYRPWGWYQTLELSGRYQVKRIVVYPGGRLSLQTHLHRAEHWVVVKGTARVTVGEQVSSLTENQSTYIPLGAVHRLENPGRIEVEIIEVQTGSYLGEDDIVRIEDDYARR